MATISQIRTKKHRKEHYPNSQFCKDLWLILGRFRCQFVLWYLLRLAGASLGLLTPYSLAKIIDFFTSYTRGSSLTTFYLWVSVILGASVIGATFRLVSKYNISRIGREARVIARLRAVNNVLNYTLAWHEHENTGNKVQRISTGSSAFRRILGFLSSQSAEILVSIGGAAIVFASLNLKYGVLLVVYVVTYLTAEFYFNRRISARTNLVKAYSERVSGKMHEFISNIATVKSLGMGGSVKQNLRHLELYANELQQRLSLLGSKKWWTIQMISNIFLFFFILLVGFDIVQGLISVGMLMLFFSYFGRAWNALNGLSFELDNLIENKYAFYRMTPFLKEVPRDEGAAHFPKQWKKIVFDNVWFKYKNKYVIKGISLTITHGEKIGLVGHSGGGKSSLFKLLVNLYQPQKGTVSVDGKPVSSILRKSLTDHITIVPQEVELFNDSLKNNVVLGASFIPSKFRAVLKSAVCDNIVAKLTNGIETHIGEKGVRLSGGEKQRVGIARALYTHADIILLDESTSHLDSVTEAQLQENLERLRERTVIAIAHRLSTLRHVHRIVVIEKGRIVEQGSFDDLLQKKGLFCQLYKLQEKKGNGKRSRK